MDERVSEMDWHLIDENPPITDLDKEPEALLLWVKWTGGSGPAFGYVTRSKRTGQLHPRASGYSGDGVVVTHWAKVDPPKQG